MKININESDKYKSCHFTILPPNHQSENNDGKYWHVVDDNDSCVIWCAGFNQSNENGALALRVMAVLNYCKNLDTDFLLCNNSHSSTITKKL